MTPKQKRLYYFCFIYYFFIWLSILPFGYAWNSHVGSVTSIFSNILIFELYETMNKKYVDPQIILSMTNTTILNIHWKALERIEEWDFVTCEINEKTWETLFKKAYSPRFIKKRIIPEWSPKKDDVILVSNDGEIWEERIFIKKSGNNYICKIMTCETHWQDIWQLNWTYWKPFKK